jgi:hypothetical protein
MDCCITGGADRHGSGGTDDIVGDCCGMFASVDALVAIADVFSQGWKTDSYASGEIKIWGEIDWIAWYILIV